MVYMLVVGFIIFSSLILFAFKFFSDKKEFTNQNIKIKLENGGYECQNCGNRNLTTIALSCDICGIRFES